MLTLLHKHRSRKLLLLTVVLVTSALTGCEFSTNFSFSDKQQVPQAPKLQDMSIEQLLPFAKKGNLEAQYQLASNYEARFFFNNAFKWYEKAAEKGHADSQLSLGYLYYFGRGADVDQKMAFRWFTKAAQKNDTYAQSWLGVLLRDGEGTPINLKQAFQWFAKAAGQGDAFAQYEMANMYASGNGVTKDMSKAIKWYGRSADQGDVEAQNTLGALLYNGEEVKADYDKAGSLFKNASKQGYAVAQSNLSRYYLEAKAEPIDTVLAYAWFILARQSDSEAVDAELADIVNLMTDSQIAEARRLADRWRLGQSIAREPSA